MDSGCWYEVERRKGIALLIVDACMGTRGYCIELRNEASGVTSRRTQDAVE